MKRLLIALTLAVGSIATPASAADVGVSVSVGQPGFYGRIDIGNYPYPQPRVIYTQPRVIERVVITREPIYLRVPPGHRKHWAKHCSEYNACGERVYFVQDDWYEREYVPVYQEYRGDNRNEHRENRREYDRNDDSGNRHNKKGNDHHGSNGRNGHGNH